jgi:hypothetical protein
MRSGRSIRAVAAALLLTTTSLGCYSYKETVTPPAPGSDVRVRLTNEAAIERSNGLPEPVTTLEGELLDSRSDMLELVVIRDQLRDQFRQNVVFADTLQVATTEVQFMEVQELSWLKTGILAAAIGVGVALVASQAIEAGGGGEGDPGKEPTQIIDFFRLAPNR